ncbi:kinesin heavy chain-like isoform X1 [Tachysurus vachellii]|uniref:kinesin heavy chain-like isoform X1 n=1 Tax=Tachysurus vachellii TaxID=175792 RepID=UPI00296AA7F7|nr:kinesin heavy chain-like isoform X1 [Tachysurus vachellii]
MAQECGVRVLCRFRPMNESEVKRGSKHIQFKGSDTLVVSGKPYVFDQVFPPNTTQEQVYESCAKDTVRDVLDGYNGTIFTYGQTSSGKTHTMEGRLHDPQMMGIIPRIAHDIFDHIYSIQENLEFHIKVSYFEIYLEKIRDLLDVSKTNLGVHENKNRVPYVKGCTERFVSSPEEMMEVIDDGKANRHVAVTNMNEHSSRSHSIFLINIKQEHLDTAHKLTGKLYLVDLAGSEKVSKTGAAGTVLDEARMINKSLSALGNVISALAEGTKTHVPYRDSKMTRILQDSLGGNCRTTIIICCSPSVFNEAETRSTLLFGQRAKSIRNTVRVNLELTAEEWKKKYNKEKQKGVDMKELIEKLQSELHQCRTGVYVPVMEQLSDKTQEELCEHTPIICNSLATDASVVERVQYEKNVNNLFLLMDDKDEEINLQTQLVEKLRLQMEVQEEFMASSQRDCARVQEELRSLQRDNQEMRGEVRDMLSALEELALKCDEKSHAASDWTHTDRTLSEQLGVKNEMLAATQGELAELQELYAVQKRRMVDVLRVLLRDLGDMGTSICDGEIKMVCEAGVSLDDEVSVVRLFLTKLKSELKRLLNHIQELESTQECASIKIQDDETELASCHVLISQYQVKIRSLTESAQKAEETRRALENAQRTLEEELTKLHTYESNQDLCEFEKQKELLKMTQSQQSQCHLIKSSTETPSKMLVQLREELNNKQKMLNKLKESNEILVLEHKRLQFEYETLRLREQEKDLKLQKLTMSKEKTEHTSDEMGDFEETLVRQLQSLHHLRKMFVQDLTTRVKKNTEADCKDGGSCVLHKHKMSFLEHNLEHLTKAHKQLLRENAALRCELPKLEKRLCAMTERVKALECTLKETKQRASRERSLYRQEVDRIKDAIRAKNVACCGPAALITKPIRAGHHHTFSVTPRRGGPTIYSYHHA